MSLLILPLFQKKEVNCKEKEDKKDGKWQNIQFWVNYPYKIKYDSHIL